MDQHSGLQGDQHPSATGLGATACVVVLHALCSVCPPASLRVSAVPSSPDPLVMFWIWAETAQRQALLNQSQGLRAASQARSRSPVRADTGQHLAASALSQAAQMEQMGAEHDRRALVLMMQPGSAAPDPDADDQMTVAWHFRLAASSFRSAARLYELHRAELAGGNHPTLGQTPEAAFSVLLSPSVKSAHSSILAGTTQSP